MEVGVDKVGGGEGVKSNHFASCKFWEMGEVNKLMVAFFVLWGIATLIIVTIKKNSDTLGS